MLNRWRTRSAFAAMALVMLATLLVAGSLIYLKLNEASLVFESAQTRHWTGLPLPSPPATQPLQIPAPGGPLHGYAETADATRALGYWVLHLHGNADSAFSPTQLRNMQRLREQGFAVLAFDYRGFGPSPGAPSEQGMVEDAEAAWQWLVAQGVAPTHIIIWGHSLGSGPAVQLATRHHAAALVLFGAFTSIADVAAERYPWLPVRWVVGIRFNSLQRMPQVKMPVVIAHSLTDQTIPFAHAGKLFAAAPEPKRLLPLTMIHDDGLGGHVTALYDQLNLLMPLLRDVAGVPWHADAAQ